MRPDLRLGAVAQPPIRAENIMLSPPPDVTIVQRARLKVVVAGRDVGDGEVAVLVAARRPAIIIMPAASPLRGDGVDHRAFDRLSLRADDGAGDLRELHRQEREVGVLRFLSGGDRNLLRLGRRSACPENMSARSRNSGSSRSGPPIRAAAHAAIADLHPIISSPRNVALT